MQRKWFQIVAIALGVPVLLTQLLVQPTLRAQPATQEIAEQDRYQAGSPLFEGAYIRIFGGSPMYSWWAAAPGLAGGAASSPPVPVSNIGRIFGKGAGLAAVLGTMGYAGTRLRGRPYFAHHEGLTIMATGATVGGALGLSALLFNKPGDGKWEKWGTLTFTLPFAFSGTLLGLLISPNGFPMIVGGVGGGLAGGAIGHSVGEKAANGSTGAKTGITIMGILSIPSALMISSLYWLLWYES